MERSEKYNLDNVANVESGDTPAPLSWFPENKGNSQMDGVISVDTDAKLTYKADDAFPSGARVVLDATTDLPMGEGARATYSGGFGHIIDWPKAFE